MRHLTLIAALLALAGSDTVNAQEPRGLRRVELGPGDVGRAALEAMEFVMASQAKDAGLAKCSLTKAVGETEVGAMQPSELDRLQVVPNSRNCEPPAFREAGKPVVYFESTAVKTSKVVLPYWDQINVEVELQIINGHFQEWQRFTLRPYLRMAMDEPSRITGWRVVKFEVIRFLHTNYR